jgi:5-methylcytosine-specific restriction endonuclease McrA
MKRTKTTRAKKSIGKVIPVRKVNKSKLKKNLDVLWSMAVKARDKKCQRCGSTGSLSAHHVFGRRHNATRWVLDNGITLCYPCHIHWAHHDVGSFSAWWIDKNGSEKFNWLSAQSKMIYADKNIPFDTIAMTLNNAILIGEMEGR